MGHDGTTNKRRRREFKRRDGHVVPGAGHDIGRDSGALQHGESFGKTVCFCSVLDLPVGKAAGLDKTSIDEAHDLVWQSVGDPANLQSPASGRAFARTSIEQASTAREQATDQGRQFPGLLPVVLCDYRATDPVLLWYNRYWPASRHKSGSRILLRPGTDGRRTVHVQAKMMVRQVQTMPHEERDWFNWQPSRAVVSMAKGCVGHVQEEHELGGKARVLVVNVLTPELTARAASQRFDIHLQLLADRLEIQAIADRKEKSWWPLAMGCATGPGCAVRFLCSSRG
ncbi:hypothetical protein BDW75DRAFT_243682 [Aspergillus navahoensis]